MLTNFFHNNSEYIGISIERIKTEFVVSVAFKIDGKWNAKTLRGIFGDLCDEKIFKRVIEEGFDLDEQAAQKLFSNALSLNLDYYSKSK